eukprot:scpid110175/ scgid35570/ 
MQTSAQQQELHCIVESGLMGKTFYSSHSCSAIPEAYTGIKQQQHYQAHTCNYSYDGRENTTDELWCPYGGLRGVWRILSVSKVHRYMYMYTAINSLRWRPQYHCYPAPS